MYPLQERASMLREAFQKQQQEEKSQQTQRLIHEKEGLKQLFSTDFPELYQLLLASKMAVEGDTTLNGQKVILSYQDRQLSITYETRNNELHKWCFRGKEYFGKEKESEQRLIIALADAFEQAQSKAKI